MNNNSMGIYNLIEKLKELAIEIPMVSGCSIGDVMKYDDKASVKYPYVNIDVVKADVKNFVQTYTLRIYTLDRNKPYIAFNKCENILNTFLKNNDLDTVNYLINYCTLDYKDMVNGCWTDMEITVPLVTECDTFTDLGEGYINQEQNSKYILNEEGDLIKIDKID